MPFERRICLANRSDFRAIGLGSKWAAQTCPKDSADRLQTIQHPRRVLLRAPILLCSKDLGAWSQVRGGTIVLFPPFRRYWPALGVRSRIDYAVRSFRDDNCSDRPAKKSGRLPYFFQVIE